MKAIDYLNNLINWGNVFAPVTIAERIRNAAIILGYSVDSETPDIDSSQVTLYINRYN